MSKSHSWRHLWISPKCTWLPWQRSLGDYWDNHAI